MSHNTFGHMFRVTTWGESHGPAIGCVVDGCPPLLTLSEAYIQGFLDKRRPGTSRFTTQRREPDRVKILSGILPRALAEGAPGMRPGADGGARAGRGGAAGVDQAPAARPKSLAELVALPTTSGTAQDIAAAAANLRPGRTAGAAATDRQSPLPASSADARGATRPPQGGRAPAEAQGTAVATEGGSDPGPSTEELVTTGTPIALLIENVDARSKDYSDIAQSYRPGHADYTYDAKYGIRDFRGGGRSSARETAMRVAAGAIARLVVPGMQIRGALVQIGRRGIDRRRWDWAAVDENPFFCPDAETAKLWEADLDKVRKAGSSVGAIVEVEATGVPAGLGAPIYGKLDQDLAGAMMSINAVKGVEIGAGFAAAAFSGEENADEMRAGPDGRPVFLSNHAGGILGGISSGQPILVRFAVKPTSSILTPRKTVTRAGAETDISTKGRHDPCVGIRAVPIGEAMLAIVLADHYLRHRAQVG